MNSQAPRRILLAFHTFGHSYMHVPALLGRTGLPVDAVMTRRHPLRGIRGISRNCVVEPSEWAAVVEERLLSGDYVRFFNVDEPGLRQLYRHSWLPEVAKFLPFPPGGEVASIIRSKKAFHEWCRRRGLPCPETHFCSSFQEACELRSRLCGSWLIKADAGSGGQNVMRHPSEVDPEDVLESGIWLVQRDEGVRVGSGIFLADHGRVLAWIGIKKIVCLNRGYGPTVLGCGDDSPDVGDLCERVAEASGVSGLTGFDFVRNDRNEPLLIDSHLGRMSPMQHFDRDYGVDFSSALLASLKGEKSPVQKPAPGPGFVKFPEAVQLVMQGSLVRLVKAVDLPMSMPLFPPQDPLTGLRSVWNILFSQARVNIGRFRRVSSRLLRSPSVSCAAEASRTRP